MIKMEKRIPLDPKLSRGRYRTRETDTRERLTKRADGAYGSLVMHRPPFRRPTGDSLDHCLLACWFAGENVSVATGRGVGTLCVGRWD